MSPTEINPDRNRAWSHWKATATEWLSVIISCAGFVIAITALILAIHAQVRASYQDKLIAELETDVGVLSNRVVRQDAWLKARGITIEEEEK